MRLSRAPLPAPSPDGPRALSSRGGGMRVSARAALSTLLLAAGCSDGAGPVVDPNQDCALATVAHPNTLAQVGSVQHVHDPAIFKHGDSYYLYSTNDGIPIRQSRDLVQWSFVGRVFEQQLPPWARAEIPGVEAPWAPDLSFFNGRYHLYYSLSTFGSQRSAIGVATNATLDPADPRYRWEDQGKVLESWPTLTAHNAIDPAVAFDEQGQPWLSWGSWSGGIYLRRLDASTGKLSQQDTVQHFLAARGTSPNAIEGPYVIRRGDFFYLFVSWDLCCRGAESTYNVRVGRSRSITGPYLDRNGVAMTQGGGTLVLAGYGRVRGPGHNSILSEGGEHLMVHHFYDLQENGVPKLQIRPLFWDVDGWPLAGESYEPGDLNTPPAAQPPTGSWGYWTDEQPPTRIRLHADGKLERCSGEGTWSYAAPWLTLRWTATGQTESVRVSGDGDEFVGRNPAGGIVRGYRVDGS